MFRKGQRVRHPTQPDWGLGEVLEDSAEESTRVFFVGVGEKAISAKYVSLVAVKREEASDPILDNLHLSQAPGIKYQSLPKSIQYFLERFPQGFYGENYLEQERNYKVAAHELAVATLNKDALTALCASGSYGEVCVRSLKLVNATNLIFPNEKMALKDGLGDDDAKQRFSESLLNVLYGIDEEAQRFDQFAGVLERIGAGKWTTASYFPFLVHPQRHMFVKPTITQNAAAVSHFNIDYRPTVTWRTYSRILAFSEHLRTALVELKPRDMIDVQSFMWCIAPHK